MKVNNYIKKMVTVVLSALFLQPVFAQEEVSTAPPPSASISGFITPQALGSPDSDLVFTPVTPCRIVDTRLTGAGRILANTSRGFYSHGANLVGQGGGNCNNPSFDPAGIAINVTVTNHANGFVTVYPFGVTRPLASTVNFKTGVDLANSTVVKTAIGAGFDFNVFANSDTHVVIDLLGYFAPPVRTRPDAFTTAEVSDIVPDNSSSGAFYSPNCPTGYALTGGGIRWSNAVNNLHTIVSEPFGNRWRCWGYNSSGAQRTMYCQAQCLRIPGR